MDHTDNIANVFLPQIMKVKESMIALKVEATDLESYISWIKVRKFCEFDKILQKKRVAYIYMFIVRTIFGWQTLKYFSDEVSLKIIYICLKVLQNLPHKLWKKVQLDFFYTKCFKFHSDLNYWNN